jgi:hypothetical protein
MTMRRLRVLGITVAIATLVITALGTPASAIRITGGDIVVVNGIPGTKVDVCVNGKEIRSKLPYGGKVARFLSASQKVLKIYKKDPRKCRGKLLAKRRFDLLPDSSYTFVVGKTRPKIAWFDNTFNRAWTTFAWRHAGDMGPVVMRYDFWDLQGGDVPVEPFRPALTNWVKTDSFDSIWAVGLAFRLKASWPGQHRPIAKSPIVTFDGRSAEWLLVGTNAKNARFVVVYWPLVPIGP